MRERSWTHIVRWSGALALVWVLVAVASWAIASGGSGRSRQTRSLTVVVRASQASLRLPALNATLPAMRVKHRRRPHTARHEASRTPTTHLDAQVTDTKSTSSESPASSGTTSATRSSSGAASSSSGTVPPTGGAPPP